MSWHGLRETATLAMRLLCRYFDPSSVFARISIRQAVCPWLEWLMST